MKLLGILSDDSRLDLLSMTSNKSPDANCTPKHDDLLTPCSVQNFIQGLQGDFHDDDLIFEIKRSNSFSALCRHPRQHKPVQDKRVPASGDDDAIFEFSEEGDTSSVS